MSAIAAALLGSIAKAFFESFGRALADMLQAWRTDQLNQQLGQARAELAQAHEAARVQAELADEAAKTVTVDDTLDRLDKGSA